MRERKLTPLALISTLGETVTPELRQLVRDVFGCKIDDMYSSQEVGYIALQCPKYDHYHIQSESCLVEILNDDNQLCKIGEMGRVIVTSLQNYIMPLIRYEIGDYAIRGPACDCGITLPVVSRIIGRTRNLLTYPDGSKGWPYYDPLGLMEILPNSRFQIVQVTREKLNLNIITSENISVEKWIR